MCGHDSLSREILYKRLDDALKEIGDNDPENWKLIKYRKFKKDVLIKEVDVYNSPMYKDRQIVERDGKCICGVPIDNRYHVYNEKINVETVLGCVCIDTIFHDHVLKFSCRSCSKRFKLSEERMETYMCGKCTKRHIRPCKVCENDSLIFQNPRGICDACEEEGMDYAHCLVCGGKETGCIGAFDENFVCDECETKGRKRRCIGRNCRRPTSSYDERYCGRCKEDVGKPRCEECYVVISNAKYRRCYDCNTARFDASCPSCGTPFFSHGGRFHSCFSCSKNRKF